MVAGQHPNRHAETVDLRACKRVIDLLVRIAHHEVAVDHHEVGTLAAHPGKNFAPIVQMMFLACAEVKVGYLN
jgi:hypothetical protein